MREAETALIPSRAGRVLAALAALACACAFPAPGAWAQSLDGGSGQFNAGYGGSGALNQAINVRTRDANENQVFIDGVMQTPEGSVFARTSGYAGNAASGVGGSGSSTAIGNNLVVVTQGSYNRVVVNSTQINNGDVSAGVDLNGRVNIDADH